MFTHIFVYICIFMLCFETIHGQKLKIGLLRHITIEEAEALSIDAEAERLIIQEARARGHTIDFINPLKNLYTTESRSTYDVVINRAEIDTFTDNITDGYLRALDYFEACDIPVINSQKATLLAQDKFRTLLFAKKAGLRVPLTFIVHSRREVVSLAQEHKIAYPFMLKKPYGGCGKGVFLIKNYEALCDALEQHFSFKEAILVEEYINLQRDLEGNVQDMRLWVVRDANTNCARFVGGAWRRASRGNFLTNTSQGGRLSALAYEQQIARFAERALDSIGADVAGIDVAKDVNGNLWLIEINISFFTGKIFQELIGINIWKDVIDLAEAKAKQS